MNPKAIAVEFNICCPLCGAQRLPIQGLVFTSDGQAFYNGEKLTCIAQYTRMRPTNRVIGLFKTLHQRLGQRITITDLITEVWGDNASVFTLSSLRPYITCLRHLFRDYNLPYEVVSGGESSYILIKHGADHIPGRKPKARINPKFRIKPKLNNAERT